MKSVKINVFQFIPLIKWKIKEDEKNSIVTIFLFGFIPLLKIKSKNRRSKIYLFGLLPISSIKTRTSQDIKKIDILLNNQKTLSTKIDAINKHLDERIRIASAQNNERFFKNRIKDIIEADVPQNTVMILDLSSAHGEVMPSVVHYFITLGCKVHMVILEENFVFDIFSRFNWSEEQFRLFQIPNKNLTDLFFKNFIRYKYIFFTTTASVVGESFQNYIYKKYNSLYYKDNVYFIEHHIEPFNKILDEEERMRYLSHTFVLHRLPYPNDMKLPFLSPSYFGKILEKNKNSITRFITMGNFTDKRRDYSILTTSMKKLVSEGITNFEVIFVGRREAGTTTLDEDLKGLENHSHFLGTLTNHQMYSEIEKADFILALLNPEYEQHRKQYLKNRTSGTFGMTVGFERPAIISEEFAHIYGLDNTNTLSHKGNDIYEAMVRAINMTDAEYKKMQNSLRKFKKKQEDESLNNMKNVFGF